MAKNKERSKAYPAIDLEAAEETLKQVKKGIGDGPHDRSTIARALGSKSSTGGPVARKVAALAHYGMMERHGSSYKVSELGKRIISPISEKEAGEARREAFYSPSLFRELMNRFTENGQVPEMLSNIIVRDHGISDAAKENASKVFIESARYVGLVDSELKIVDEHQGRQDLGDEDATEEVHEADRKKSLVDERRSSTGGKQVFRMSLTGGRQMYWELPESLTSRDLSIIKKQIELLELQLEE